MDGNKPHFYKGEAGSNGEHGSVDERISIEQLQRLVRLLEDSNVSEIEFKRASEGTRLVLRKAKVPENAEHQVPIALDTASVPPGETKHCVVAPLVGIFHSRVKSKGGDVITIGDCVKVSQLVGTIQSLNVMNEVESPFAGRVTEIFVQDGQAVEYGQQLMTIDGREGT